MRRLQLFALGAPLLAALACRDVVTSPDAAERNTLTALTAAVLTTISPEVSAGFSHTCALKTDGTVVCWGNNDVGQSTVPSGLTSVTQLNSSHFSHTCAVKTDGTVVCWGDNDHGQASVPTGLTSVVQVSGGLYHTCAVKTDGTVVCWGNNVPGPDDRGQTTVPSGLSSVAEVSAGKYHTCARKTDGTVICWGDNVVGQATVPGGLTSAQVSAGENYTCALTTGATVVCWGDNFLGQATPPSGLTSVAQLSAGGAHACALKTDGTVVCWGYNFFGQTTVPSGLTSVAQVSAGGFHTCALKTDGTVVCWGDNFNGQTTVPSGLNLNGNALPVVNAGGPYSGSEGTPVTFNGGGSSTTPPGGTLTYTWDFGDGTPVVTATTPSVQHTYGDELPNFAPYTVRLTVTDAGGLSNTATTTAAISNVTPAVNPIPGVTILEGETFTGAGSFADPGLDTWTAIVDYGDGSGSQPLTLFGKTFQLSHLYAIAGSYSVTVTVTDDDGAAGVGQGTTIVQSPEQAARALLQTITNLVAAGALTSGNGNALIVKVQGAIAKLNAGNVTPATKKLNAFIRQVIALMGAGLLSASDGQSLIDAANRIIGAIKAHPEDLDTESEDQTPGLVLGVVKLLH